MIRGWTTAPGSSLAQATAATWSPLAIPSSSARVDEPGSCSAVFDPLDDLTAAAVEFRITEGLRRELGAEAEVSAVEVQVGPAEGQLLVAITYERRTDRVRRTLEVVL